MTYLLTSYFTRDPHPITKKPVRPDDPRRLALWYPGVVENRLHAAVFHDQLTPEFVAEYETPEIRFVKVESPPPGWSNNDWRFVCYARWLRAAELAFDSVVFACDMFDTCVKRDPEPLVRAHPQFKLWSATDERTPFIRPGTKDGDWIKAKIRSCYGDNSSEARALDNCRYYTAALVGGLCGDMQPFLDALTWELSRVLLLRPGVNANMAAVNRVLHFGGHEGCWSLWPGGAPLHSQPCKHDLNADVCFVHK